MLDRQGQGDNGHNPVKKSIRSRVGWPLRQRAWHYVYRYIDQGYVGYFPYWFIRLGILLRTESSLARSLSPLDSSDGDADQTSWRARHGKKRSNPTVARTVAIRQKELAALAQINSTFFGFLETLHNCISRRTDCSCLWPLPALSAAERSYVLALFAESWGLIGGLSNVAVSLPTTLGAEICSEILCRQCLAVGI